MDPIIKINNVTLSKASGPTDTNSPSAYLNVPNFTMMGLDFTNVAFDGAISNVMTFGNTTTNPLDTAKIYADTDSTTSGMGNLLSFHALGENEFTKRDKFGDTIPDAFAFNSTQGTTSFTLTTSKRPQPC